MASKRKRSEVRVGRGGSAPWTSKEDAELMAHVTGSNSIAEGVDKHIKKHGNRSVTACRQRYAKLRAESAAEVQTKGCPEIAEDPEWKRRNRLRKIKLAVSFVAIALLYGLLSLGLDAALGYFTPLQGVSSEDASNAGALAVGVFFGLLHGRNWRL